MAKRLTKHAWSTSRKHTARFLVKSFGECFEVACYWPSSCCIPAQKFVSCVSRVTSQTFTVDVWLWQATIPLHGLYDL